ncbi:MAG: hypothetical protein ACFFD3_15250, partial [Candidatus Thorarchaeota archaeon]
MIILRVSIRILVAGFICMMLIVPSNIDASVLSAQDDITGIAFLPGSGGRVLFNQTYGPGEFHSILELQNGDLAIVGCSNRNATLFPSTGELIEDSDIFLMKTDSSGNTIWSHSYDFSEEYGSLLWIGYEVIQTNDMGFVVVGNAGNQVFLLRTDMNGNSLWMKAFGGWGATLGRGVVELEDEGFLVIGSTYVIGYGYSLYMARTDSSGNMMWVRSYEGSTETYGNSIIRLDSGRLLIAGYTERAYDTEMLVICTNLLGDIIWYRTYGFGRGESIIGTKVGNLVFIGHGNEYEPYGGNSGIHLIHTDLNGNVTQSRTYSGVPYRDLPNHFGDFSYAFVEDGNGGYYITGETWTGDPKLVEDGRFNEALLLHINRQGDVDKSYTYGSVHHKDGGYDILKTVSGAIAIVGYRGNANQESTWENVAESWLLIVLLNEHEPSLVGTLFAGATILATIGILQVQSKKQSKKLKSMKS